MRRAPAFRPLQADDHRGDKRADEPKLYPNLVKNRVIDVLALQAEQAWQEIQGRDLRAYVRRQEDAGGRCTDGDAQQQGGGRQKPSSPALCRPERRPNHGQDEDRHHDTSAPAAECWRLWEEGDKGCGGQGSKQRRRRGLDPSPQRRFLRLVGLGGDFTAACMPTRSGHRAWNGKRASNSSGDRKTGNPSKKIATPAKSRRPRNPVAMRRSARTAGAVGGYSQRHSFVRLSAGSCRVVLCAFAQIFERNRRWSFAIRRTWPIDDAETSLPTDPPSFSKQEESGSGAIRLVRGGAAALLRLAGRCRPVDGHRLLPEHGSLALKRQRPLPERHGLPMVRK